MKKNNHPTPLSPFAEKVYAFAKQIPKGKVMTYGQLAKMAGNPNASRAVGMCLKNNPDAQTIPCHRIVSANGNLTGYAFGKGISTKKQLLLAEGVVFIQDKVNLSYSQWQTDSSQ